MNMSAFNMSQSGNIKRQIQNKYLGDKLNCEQLQNIVNNLIHENDYLHKRPRYFSWKAAENKCAVNYLWFRNLIILEKLIIFGLTTLV